MNAATPSPSPLDPQAPPGGYPDGINPPVAGVYTRDIRAEGDGTTPPLPCLEGPCRYFTEIGQVQGVVEGMEHLRRYQYCERLVEETTTMPLHELTIRYCSRYSPPWWHLGGWRQRLRSVPYLIRRAKRTHVAPKLGERLLAATRKRLDKAGLSQRLGIMPTPNYATDDRKGTHDD